MTVLATMFDSLRRFGVEVALIYYGVSKGHTLNELAGAVWDENTQAIFSAIVGFWFGNRMLTRASPMAATLAITAPPAAKAAPARPVAAAPAAIIPAPPGSRT
jgi:hypothetical protein